jgi:hypothetical protein
MKKGKNMVFVNLDANESAFFVRELTFIKSRSYDIIYPEFKAVKHIPVTNEAGPGADVVLYRQFNMVGMMQLIANYAADLPRSDVKGLEFSVIVKSIGGSYGYNIQEIRAAQMVGRPLDARRALAVRFAYDQYINKLGWLGDGSATWGGMYGLLFQPNTTKGNAITGTWSTATADQIIADFQAAYNSIISTTKGVEVPDTCLLPIAQYTRLATTPRSTISDTTVLEFLEKAFPGVTFDWVNELKDVTSTAGKKPDRTTGSTDCMVLYRNSPDKLTYEIPQPFEQLAPQERNLEYVVPAHGRVAGVLVYYPLSISVLQGI